MRWNLLTLRHPPSHCLPPLDNEAPPAIHGSLFGQVSPVRQGLSSSAHRASHLGHPYLPLPTEARASE